MTSSTNAESTGVKPRSITAKSIASRPSTGGASSNVGVRRSGIGVSDTRTSISPPWLASKSPICSRK